MKSFPERYRKDKKNVYIGRHFDRKIGISDVCVCVQVEVEEKLKAQVDLISAHLGSVENRLEKERSVERAKQSESKINSRIQAVVNNFQAELEQMRREYQSGESGDLVPCKRST